MSQQRLYHGGDSSWREDLKWCDQQGAYSTNASLAVTPKPMVQTRWPEGPPTCSASVEDDPAACADARALALARVQEFRSKDAALALQEQRLSQSADSLHRQIKTSNMRAERYLAAAKS